MRFREQWWCTLVVMMLVTGTVGADVVLDRTPADTGASTVLMWASGQGWTLVDPKTGLEGVAPTVDSRRTSSGGTIEWRVVRDETDELGMRHLFYEQGFRPARGSVTLPLTEAGDVVPLHGGGLGFHYAPDGRLKIVGGARFEDVAAVDGLALVTPEAAREMAEWAMLNHGEVAVATLDELGAALAASLRERTTLSLRSTGDGRSFEFVWVVPMITAEGRSLDTAIHGRTGDLLAMWDPNPTFDGDAKILTLPGCNEGSAASTSARVVPQNSNITYTRAFFASAATDLQAYYGNGVTHEGRRPYGSSIAEIVSYFGVSTWSQDQCPDMDEAQYFRRLPVKTISLQRRYDNFFDLDEPVPGRAAGDGAYKAYLTLSTFKNLGWSGLSKVNIVANSYRCVDNAGWWRNADELAPGDSVVFCRISTDYDDNFVADDDGHFLHSATLDFVGHELGHGMLFQVAHWNYDQSVVDRQLHEGWADVLGLIAEWSIEPAGNGFERADWLLGEDIRLDRSPVRRVDASADDGVGGFSLHASDPPGDASDPYQTGLRIPLAFRLAVTGGYNPVCGRLSASGCDNPDGVDLRPFDEVAKIFFRTVQYYAGANEIETFSDIVYYASVAAHDLFWLDDSSSPPACTDGAIQQHTIREAFEAVGHPAAGGFICTCQPNCDIYEW